MAKPLNASNFIPLLELPDPALEAMLHNVIQRQLSKDKPKHIAVPCSSGVDSTLVLALAKECFDGKITAISIGFNDSNDETEQARKIAETLDIDCRCGYIDNPFDSWDKQLAIVGEPRHNLYWYYVAELAKSIGADMLLTGDGGDEVFGGYTFHYNAFLHHVGGNQITAYLEGHSRDWTHDHEKMFTPEMQFNWNDIYAILEPSFDSRIDPLSRVMLADYNGKLLYDYLPTNTAFAKHFKLQLFAPILDKAIILYGCQLRVEGKYGAQTDIGKLPLRRILASRNLDHLLAKKKQGFGMNLLEVYPRTKHQFPRPELIVKRKIINPDWLEKALDKATTDVRYTNKILMLHALELWLTTND